MTPKQRQLLLSVTGQARTSFGQGSFKTVELEGMKHLLLTLGTLEMIYLTGKSINVQIVWPFFREKFGIMGHFIHRFC